MFSNKNITEKLNTCTFNKNDLFFYNFINRKPDIIHQIPDIFKTARDI